MGKIKSSAEKKRIINVHTHVFTSDFVPPYLARSFVPAPFYKWIKTSFITGKLKEYFQNKYKLQYGNNLSEKEYELLKKQKEFNDNESRKNIKREYRIKSKWYKYYPLKLLFIWLSILSTFYIFDLIGLIFFSKEDVIGIIKKTKVFLQDIYLYFDISNGGKIFVAITTFWFIPRSRKLFWFLLKKAFPFLKSIFSQHTLDLIERYYLMGRFAIYKHQSDIAQRAINQLPKDSSMVILPMDMEYMEAGKTRITEAMCATKEKKIQNSGWSEFDFKDTYKYQMRELWDLVNSKDHNDQYYNSSEKYLPFVFIDPRRYEEEGTDFFNYKTVNKKIVLEECFVKTYIEDRRFHGFKIYPALGYYPFDELLLPIWLYAAQNNIPIMSHCIVGTIFYRGEIKETWREHPVFKSNIDLNKKMLLSEKRNIDFQRNFTHPLNYLCLLEEQFLIQILKNSKNKSLQSLFGLDSKNNTIATNLSNLKICLAHYGGADEWKKYMEQERQTYNHRLMKKPTEGIQFMKNNDGVFSHHKIHQIWQETDWYSIISSLLTTYENMYADVSYIVSKPSIYPLLQYSLEKGDNYYLEHQNYLFAKTPEEKAKAYKGKNRLRSRILFGTDFYVVRNHNSDKELFINVKTSLDEESFDLIARENSHNYLFG